MRKELTEGTPLSSVRALAKELKISALTVKKAYDFLEEEGLIATAVRNRITGASGEAWDSQGCQEKENVMLKFVDARKQYGTFELVCNMEVKPGMVTGLIGANGKKGILVYAE